MKKKINMDLLNNPPNVEYITIKRGGSGSPILFIMLIISLLILFGGLM